MIHHQQLVFAKCVAGSLVIAIAFVLAAILGGDAPRRREPERHEKQQHEKQQHEKQQHEKQRQQRQQQQPSEPPSPRPNSMAAAMMAAMSNVEQFQDLPTALTPLGASVADQFTCVVGGHAFRTGVLLKNSNDPAGRSCVVNGDALGILTDKTACSPTPDDPSVLWLNPLGPSGNGGVASLGQRTLVGGLPQCPVTFSPDATAQQLSAFDDALFKAATDVASGAPRLRKDLGDCKSQLEADESKIKAAADAAAAAAAASAAGAGASRGMTIQSKLRENFCTVVKDGSKDSMAQVFMYDCKSTDNEKWQLDEKRRLVNKNSGMCLNVNGAGTQDGAQIIQYPCDDETNQFWTFNNDGTIRPDHAPGKCLDVYGLNKDNGATLNLWTCNGGVNQQFFKADDMTINVRDTVYDGLPTTYGDAAFAIDPGNSAAIDAFKRSKSFTVDGGAPLNVTGITMGAHFGKDVVSYGPGRQPFKSYTDHAFKFST